VSELPEGNGNLSLSFSTAVLRNGMRDLRLALILMTDARLRLGRLRSPKCLFSTRRMGLLCDRVRFRGIGPIIPRSLRLRMCWR
jgi:hypothetical protein